MTTAPFVMCFPPGSLQPEDRAALKEAGIIAIEVSDPKQIVAINPVSLFTADDFGRACLAAIASSPSGRGPAARLMVNLNALAERRLGTVIPLADKGKK